MNQEPMQQAYNPYETNLLLRLAELSITNPTHPDALTPRELRDWKLDTSFTGPDRTGVDEEIDRLADLLETVQTE